MTPLQRVVECAGDISALQQLLIAGAVVIDVNGQLDPLLHELLVQHERPGVRALVDAEVTLQSKFPMHYNARNNHLPAIKTWLESRPSTSCLTQKDQDGKTIFLHAATGFDPAKEDNVLCYLLSVRLDPTVVADCLRAKDKAGKTVLHELVTKQVVCVNDPDGVSNQVLLQTIRNVQTKTKCPIDATTLCETRVRGGGPFECERCCVVARPDVISLLDLAHHKQWSDINAILKLNNNITTINDTDENGMALIHIVVDHNAADTLELLLTQSHIDVNKRGYTLTLENDRPRCVELLLAAGADFSDLVGRKHWSPVYTEAASSKLVLDSWELKKKYPMFHMARLSNIDAAEAHMARGETALHAAAGKKLPEAILEAIYQDYSSTPPSDSESTTTPLMIAASNGLLANVEFLLRQGVDVDSQDADEWTALVHASVHGYYDVVQALLDALADIEVTVIIPGTQARGTVIDLLQACGETGGTERPTLIALLVKEARTRSDSVEFREKQALRLLTHRSRRIFSKESFARAIACSSKVGLACLDDCIDFNQHGASFTGLHDVYGETWGRGALLAVLTTDTKDAGHAFEIRRDCLEHPVFRRVLAIKWELMGQRKFTELLLMNSLLLLTATTASVLTPNEPPLSVAVITGVTAIVFVAVGCLLVQVLRPTLLWRLSRFLYDFNWAVDHTVTIPDLGAKKALVRRWLAALTPVITASFVVPIVYAFYGTTADVCFYQINGAILGCTTLYFLYHELREMVVNWTEYMASPVNKAQLSLYLLILLIFLPAKVGWYNIPYQVEVGVGGAITLMLWVLSLQFLEVVPSASFLLPMMARLFGDIANFFVLFGVLQLGLTVTFYQLFREQPDAHGFGSLTESFMTTYFVAFGQLPLDSLSAFDSQDAYTVALYTGTALLMMVHVAVVVIVLLNVLLAMMNQTVTDGLEKAKTQALVSYAQCILRLEQAMDLSAADTTAYLHDGKTRVLNPIFFERVPKDQLGLEASQMSSLIARLDERDEWVATVATLEAAIDMELKHLRAGLHQTSHFIAATEPPPFAKELEIIDLVHGQLKAVMAAARQSNGLFYAAVRPSIVARVTHELAKLKPRISRLWAFADGNGFSSGFHEQEDYMLVYQLVHASTMDVQVDKAVAAILRAVKDTLAEDRASPPLPPTSERPDEEASGFKALEEVAALRAQVTQQTETIAALSAKVADMAKLQGASAAKADSAREEQQAMMLKLEEVLTLLSKQRTGSKRSLLSSS
ncbi:hypothetical protein ACHHYP_02669 [Achlya hypogyna]|uniref:Uncharacterized protein n=1 Tax=Achlya hypogyna TaxID=1202772 RepID=A0A1V9Z658_ACHHY|nr:hypothetical protein ACHHYP_02669 [Achlya hypogyna]